MPSQRNKPNIQLHLADVTNNMTPAKSPYRDSQNLRQQYALSKGKDQGSGRSLSSTTTDWSTTTNPTSNTTKARAAKKNQKRRFRAFANFLMRFLERRDPRVFDEAQAVIRDCEERKRQGEAGFESVTDSLKRPLKQVVGKNYWKQAGIHLEESSHQVDDSLEPLSPTESIPGFSRSAMQFLEYQLQPENEVPSPPPRYHRSSPLSAKSCRDPAEEKKLQKDRFWMLIRVLMKYLEHTDYELFQQAREAIYDCARRNKKHEKGYESLGGSIQRTLKNLVGTVKWRRAESLLSKEIIKQTERDALEADWSVEAEAFQLPFSNPTTRHDSITPEHADVGDLEWSINHPGDNQVFTPELAAFDLSGSNPKNTLGENQSEVSEVVPPPPIRKEANGRDPIESDRKKRRRVRAAQ